MELSTPDAERLRAIRSAVESELRLLDELLAHTSIPGLKRAIATARRELTEIEPNLLGHVADSPDPGTLLAGAELYLTRVVRARELAQQDPNVTLAG